MSGHQPRVDDIDLLREVYLSPDPIVTAKEIAQKLDDNNLSPATRQGVRERFIEYIDNGWMERREVGSKAVVYWLTDEGKRKVVEG